MRRHAPYETEELVRALEVDGYACIAHALTPAQCSGARDRIDELEPEHWDETAQRCDRALDRYLNVFNRDPYWLQFLDRPGVIDLAECVLGADCHIIGETAWRSHPGFSGDPLHVDYAPLRWREDALGDIPIPIFILTVHYYLNDVTPELAPTRVVPGSHRAGRAPEIAEVDWQGHTAQQILASVGDALVFRSDVWHGGSDNRSNAGARYLLQVHYGRREMAQHFSPFIEWRFNPRVIAAASRRQRRLLGEHEPAAYD